MKSPISMACRSREVIGQVAEAGGGAGRRIHAVLSIAASAVLLLAASPAMSQVLGTASSFAVLGANPNVTNTGPTVVAGSVGIFPALLINGFPPGLIAPGTGVLHFGDAVAQQAQSDNTAAFGVLTGLASAAIPAQLGGQVLGPGIYRPIVGDFDLTGTLTLTIPGLYVFQTAAGLVTSSGGTSAVNLGGASPCDLWWTVPSSATIGTGSAMAGNILALTSITIGTGASLQGRALAQTGTVTVASNAITACSGGTIPGFLVPPIAAAPPSGFGLGAPTLSEWAMIALAAMLAGAGLKALRRQEIMPSKR